MGPPKTTSGWSWRGWVAKDAISSEPQNPWPVTWHSKGSRFSGSQSQGVGNKISGFWALGIQTMKLGTSRDSELYVAR